MADRDQIFAELNAEVQACQKCALAKTRTKAVPGEGPLDAEIMLIGEGPGFHEDQQGRPFVGASGRFLEELLRSIGYRRDQVYITNVVKCRPPDNRDPAPDEIRSCAPYLDSQVGALSPKIVITLGRYSMAKFFPGQSITRIHGQPKREPGRIIFPMFHPASALHDPSKVDMIKQDMLKIPALLDSLRTAAASAVAPLSLSTSSQTTVAPENVEADDDGSPTQLSLFG